MKRFIAIVSTLFIAFAFIACDHHGMDDDIIQRIEHRGKIVAAMGYNSTEYFIYRGYPMGFQLELLQQFAQTMHVQVKIVPTNDAKIAFDKLDEYKVDLIASDITVTKERLSDVVFTEPLFYTRQVLVQRSRSSADSVQYVEDIAQLDSKMIYIKAHSAFYETLRQLEKEYNISINMRIIEEIDEEELIEMLSKREIDYTICSEHRSRVSSMFYDNIDYKLVLTDTQAIAWALRPGADSLLLRINDWLVDFKKTKQYGLLYDKYFNQPRFFKIKNSNYSLDKGKLSNYDPLIKKYAEKLGWDWRLLAALIYQESQFRLDVQSWAGAYGLMQLMPTTAEIYGITEKSSPEQQIAAGVKYIKSIDKQLPEEIIDPKERIKFILASYNIGVGHILDARRLAQKYGKDPNKWTNNVDQYILLKSRPEYYNDTLVRNGYCRGEEAYNYVRDVMELNDHYKNLTGN